MYGSKVPLFKAINQNTTTTITDLDIILLSPPVNNVQFNRNTRIKFGAQGSSPWTGDVTLYYNRYDLAQLNDIEVIVSVNGNNNEIIQSAMTEWYLPPNYHILPEDIENLTNFQNLAPKKKRVRFNTNLFSFSYRGSKEVTVFYQYTQAQHQTKARVEFDLLKITYAVPAT